MLFIILRLCKIQFRPSPSRHLPDAECKVPNVKSHALYSDKLTLSVINLTCIDLGTQNEYSKEASDTIYQKGTHHMNKTTHKYPIALITGASRGIGRAIAESFAAAGYELILTCSRTFQELNVLAADLAAKYHIPCHAFQTDAGNADEVASLFGQICATGIDHLDVLVNNAGISYVGLLTDMSPEEWRRVMSVNLDSCFYTSRLAIPMMLTKHAGRIINISSVWGNAGASTEVAYSASKGGMNAFTKALAKELAPSNIQVNAIACGVIDTAMNACFSEEDMTALREEIPADRLGRPEEVARLALQLAQAPEYLTGQIITIDGGWL